MELYSKAMQGYLTNIEEALPAYMPSTALPQKIVCEAMAYACKAGGKRLRPVLMMSFMALCGADPLKALPFACAMEMIHCYSLVHDDLPCMDNSLLRRGRPSTFAVYGEDMALLAGDALLNFAFETALSAKTVEEVGAQVAVKATRCLAEASGIYGMVGGQTIDLQSEGKQIDLDTLKTLHDGKCGALIRASCEMGAILAGADEEKCQAASRYGAQVGLAFQIVDDTLDVLSSADTLGKPVGADTDNEKVTYVSLLGLEKAKELAAYHTQEALSALSIFGDAAEDIRKMTLELLKRDR